MLVARLLPALAFVSLPAVCLAGWFLRNWVVVGLPFGLRHPPRITWGESATAALATLVAWGLVVGVSLLVNRLIMRVTSRRKA